MPRSLIFPSASASLRKPFETCDDGRGRIADGPRANTGRAGRARHHAHLASGLARSERGDTWLRRLPRLPRHRHFCHRRGRLSRARARGGARGARTRDHRGGFVVRLVAARGQSARARSHRQARQDRVDRDLARHGAHAERRRCPRRDQGRRARLSDTWQSGDGRERLDRRAARAKGWRLWRDRRPGALCKAQSRARRRGEHRLGARHLEGEARLRARYARDRHRLWT